jgi:hypothetical protein
MQSKWSCQRHVLRADLATEHGPAPRRIRTELVEWVAFSREVLLTCRRRSLFTHD